MTTPAAHPEPTPGSLGGWRLGLRIAMVSAPPALLSLWLALPALHPPPERLEGPAAAHRACVGPWCTEVLTVAGRPLSCSADFVGVPGKCGLRGANRRGPPSEMLDPALPATAQVVRLPSLLSALGLAPTEAVLLQLEQGGQRLFRRSLQSQAWMAMYGSWLFHAVYWPLAGLLLWLWPQSGLGRRVWARLTWSAPPR